MKKRRKFCKGHKHTYIGMAGDICKYCDYVGMMDWKLKERYLNRAKNEQHKQSLPKA